MVRFRLQLSAVNAGPNMVESLKLAAETICANSTAPSLEVDSPVGCRFSAWLLESLILRTPC